MLDFFSVLDAAITSGYRTVSDLRRTMAWDRIPVAMQQALLGNLGSGVDAVKVKEIIWGYVRDSELVAENSDERLSHTIAMLHLGFLYLAYEEGRIGIRDLLTRAFRIADSYVCEIDASTFLEYRRRLTTEEVSESEVALLFGPFCHFAREHLNYWEFSRDAL